MSKGPKTLEAPAQPKAEKPLQSLRPPLLEGIAKEPAEKKLNLSPLEMALYRLTCTVNARTTPIQDAVVSLMKELGADEAAIHLRSGGLNGSLEHYMTVQKDGSGFSIVPTGAPAGYISLAAFSERTMFFSVPGKGRSKRHNSTLYQFNMIPGDTEYSDRKIKNGERHVCAVPLFMADKGTGVSNNLGVLTLKGRSLSVQDGRQTGTTGVQKSALLVACGARLLSRIVDARFDPLTELPKRPEFEAQLTKLVGEYVSGGPNFSVLMFDLDHFKAVNDTHGHEAGDRALRAAARAISSSLRGIKMGDVLERRFNGHQPEPDQCFRWGGEELSALLRGTGITEALLIADRLRRAIEGLRLEANGAEFRISVSVGVSDADAVIGRKARHDTDIENLAHKLTHDADLALYKAKEGGRNLVAYSTTTPEERRSFFIFDSRQPQN
ncbi:MAG: GGDEF domain-containing protein [Candidatus Micrarchaeota archaeon]